MFEILNVQNILCYRKLRGSDLAVLHCFGTRKTTVGEQLPAGVARFFMISPKNLPKILIFIGIMV